MSRSFFKHAAVYGAGSMLLQAAGFILLPIYTRYLVPAEFGTVEVASRLGEIFAICLMMPGLRTASHAFFKQLDNEPEQRRLVCTAITLVVSILLLATGLLMAGAGPLARAFVIDRPSILRLAFLVIFFEALGSIPLVLAQARLESSFYVATTSIQFLTKVGLGILFVVVFRWGIYGVLLASVLTSATFAIALTVRELSKGLVWPSKQTLKEMLRFASPFIAGGLGSFLLHDGDRFFLLRYAGEAAVGLYAFGYKMARLVSMFSREPLQTVWAANMYDVAKRPEASVVFGRVFTRIMGAYLLVGLALCLLQNEVTALLGGHQYARAAGVIAPVVLAYGFLAAAELMDSGFYVRRRTGVKFWITLTSTVVILALYALLIPRFGIDGAAFATLLGFVFNAWLTWRQSQRVFAVRYEYRRLATMLLLGALIWGISRFLPSSLWAIPAKLSLWLLWPSLLWWLGVLSSEEKAWAVEALVALRDRVAEFFPRRLRLELVPPIESGVFVPDASEHSHDDACQSLSGHDVASSVG
jgi:O-antigen/teichoic acid export membrane protein